MTKAGGKVKRVLTPRFALRKHLGGFMVGKQWTKAAQAPDQPVTEERDRVTVRLSADPVLATRGSSA
jgi:hypothetical protein